MNWPVPFSVGIIGGGASGVIAAIHLLARDLPWRIHLFNSGYELGGGIAYSFRENELLLNVAAGRMGVWPDHPADFHGWLEQHFPGKYGLGDFVERYLYNDYLLERLDETQQKAEHAQLILNGSRISGIKYQEGDYQVKSLNQKAEPVHVAILAVGNCTNREDSRRGPGWIPDPRYIANPWSLKTAKPEIYPGDAVLIIGSGLSAIDTILRLRKDGWRGRIDLISRHGLWPQTQQSYAGIPGFQIPALAGQSPQAVLRKLRNAARQLAEANGDWRQLFEAIRPGTNAIWSGWSSKERHQFLRHARAYWDVHRHRMATSVGKRIEIEKSEGKIHLLAGRVVSIRSEDALCVTVLRRGSNTPEIRSYALAINCTGVGNFCVDASQPLLEELVTSGLAKVDRCALGLETTRQGELIGKTGLTTPNLFCVGNLRLGSLWETTAVPEIRSQAREISQVLAERLVGRGVYASVS